MTTNGNPSFEVKSALLSRSTVYVLERLSGEDLATLLARTGIELDEGARERLIGFADGDARRLLNAVEILKNARPAGVIDAAFVESALARNLRRFDKGGEQFYDQISALHKAVRGSDADASLYWLVRMLEGGEDPLYIARRLVRAASEDVGNADPMAMPLARPRTRQRARKGNPLTVTRPASPLRPLGGREDSLRSVAATKSVVNLGSNRRPIRGPQRSVRRPAPQPILHTLVDRW